MAQINKPSDYFNTVLYTGDGTNSRAVTGVGFQPDFSWLKNRTGATAYHHQTFDSVRGASAGTLYTSLTNAEDTNYTISSFDSDGITLRATSHDSQNASGYTFASWHWLAGGTASSNTDGNLTSQVSANTTSGFSIVSWTADGTNNTVGHGLGQTPSIVIAKNRSDTSNWDTITNIIDGSIDYLKLNLTDAKVDLTGYTLNSSVFSINYPNTNNIIAYCFAEKKGFSKFGTYTGNGNADGTFVYTGFKPAWILIKKSSASGSNWTLFDNKRTPLNGTVDARLYPNASDAEIANAEYIDSVSNGFKLRASSSLTNTSGETHIYMAFAENPLVGTNNIPATAR